MINIFYENMLNIGWTCFQNRLLIFCTGTVRIHLKCMQFLLHVTAKQHAFSISFYFNIRYKADKKSATDF